MPTAQAGEPPETLKDTTYQNVKGFNYVPSYAATVWDIIDLFDEQVWDREFGYSKRFHANAIRIWCDYLSFQKDEKHFLTCWQKALDLARKHTVKLLITTANRWTDPLWPFGQVDLSVVLSAAPSQEYQHYLKTFVSAFRDHPQVLMWDLCNEPFSGGVGRTEEGRQIAPRLHTLELKFWERCFQAARSARPTQPLTLGIHSYHPANPDTVYDLVDVISCHPYAGWWANAKGFQETCDYYIRIANRRGKPLLCTETTQGSKSNKTRTEIIAVSVRELERRKIGWLAWQLMAGKIVTARWDRTDHNCKPGDESVMYWVAKDGRTRPGHDEETWRAWSG
jgi:hypothetical protein